MYKISWRNSAQGRSWLGTLKLPRFGVLRVGRARDADLRLNDPRVSRSHAFIICDGDRIEISDAGSSNGTALGNTKVSRSAWTVSEDVSIGPFELRLSRQEGLEAPPRPEPHNETSYRRPSRDQGQHVPQPPALPSANNMHAPLPPQNSVGPGTKTLGIIVNIFFPGIGSLIVGRWGQALAQLALGFLGLVLMVIPFGFIIGFPVSIGVRIWAIVTAATVPAQPVQVVIIHQSPPGYQP